MSKLKFQGKTVYTKTCVDNIIDAFHNGNRDDLNWYSRAYGLAHQMASQTTNVTVRQACGVIAALSPLKSWKENLSLAEQFVIQRKFEGHTKLCVHKAKRILSVDTMPEILDILNGEKIKSFFLNMYLYRENTGATIDRHAIEIALGKRITDHRITLKQYQFFEKCYLLASNYEDVLPHQLQAVTWEYWRKHKKTI